MGVVAEGEQRGRVAVGPQPDVAALAAVATVGPALGRVRFATERDRARAAVAGAHVELGLVDEIGGHVPLRIRVQFRLSAAERARIAARRLPLGGPERAR